MADAPQVLPNSKNDLIVPNVQKNLIEASMFAPTVRDISGFFPKGSKSAAIPKLTNFAVQNRAFGATGDATALVDSTDLVDTFKNAYIAYLYDSRDIYQSTINYQLEASARAGAAHGKDVDLNVIATILGVAGHEVSVAAFTTIKEQALELRRQVLQAGGDISKMTYGISLDKEAEMLQEADFIRADFYGSANVRSGQIGQIYGIPVMVSRNVTGTGADSMFLHDADGIGLGFQGGVEMSEQLANEYGASSMRVAVDQLYFYGGLQLGESGVAADKSALVAKLVA